MSENARFDIMVGKRILFARNELGLTQEQLSDKMGFNSRQTLGSIESGERKVSSENLLKFMQVLGRPLDFFTDPFQLVDEASVSWRAPSADRTVLTDFRNKTFPIVALYRHINTQLAADKGSLPVYLPLTESSSYEDATDEGDALAKAWGLLPIPAKNLERVIQEKLNLVILMLDAPEGISGAAIHLNRLDAIIVNRREPSGRRAYDLGHELFHVLTWNTLPPPEIDTETTQTKKQKRIEDLANRFTSALLLPGSVLKELFGKKGAQDLRSWILDMANLFEVSGQAVYWRLVHLNCITKGEDGIDPSSLVAPENGSTPKRYSTRFITCLHRGLDTGVVSVRKVLDILDLNLDDLEAVFREHNMEPPFEL